MRIFLITHFFPPEPGAPQARLSEMARSWKDMGAEVVILTTFPNHPTGVIPSRYHRTLFKKEEWNGIPVWRHWVYATPNKGFARKILGHLSFMLTVVLFSLWRGHKPDVVLVSSPTFFSVFSAWIFSWVRGAVFVFEVRDLWPGIFVELGVLKNRLLIKILEGMELFLYHKADAVVPVTESFRKDIVDRGVEPEKVFVIKNGVDLSRFGPGPPVILNRDKYGLVPEQFVVLYAGAHGISQGLLSLLDVARKVQDLDTSVRFLFVGDGAVKEKMLEKSSGLKLENVSFNPPEDKDDMRDLYQIADLVLVPLRNIKGFQMFIPSKMFEIMGSGRPILASVEGEAQSILQDSGAAVVVPPEDVDSLSEQIIKLKEAPERLNEMGHMGYNFVSKYYDREQLASLYMAKLGVLLNRVRRKAES